MPSFALRLLAAATAVLGCAEHNLHSFEHQGHGIHKRADISTSWAYEASYNWGRLNASYSLCQAGTMQAPIPLMITQGLSLNHQPTFNMTGATPGYIYNWGYGPAFTVNHTSMGGMTNVPSVTFDNVTLYNLGWHIHSPADHSVQGDRSKAEIHFVMANAKGAPTAVLAMRIDPGNAPSPFFTQMNFPIPSFGNSTTIPISLDFNKAFNEVAHFAEFWTYKGSLTSPPCTEGIRFFVARNVLFVSVEQMQQILTVSTYSARVEQEVWQHQINV